MEMRIVARSGAWIAAVALATMLQVPAAEADEISQILRGYEIIAEIFPKGTKLNFAGKDLALVGLGSYLVNSTGCNDCHTHPNWAPNHNPYVTGETKQVNTAAYLSGGRQFLKGDGTVLTTSANITPDKLHKPAGLTREEFLYAMQTGHDPVDGDILLVMPWPLYQWKTDHDLKAMYEYLRVIPHLDNNPTPGP